MTLKRKKSIAIILYGILFGKIIFDFLIHGQNVRINITQIELCLLSWTSSTLIKKVSSKFTSLSYPNFYVKTNQWENE